MYIKKVNCIFESSVIFFKFSTFKQCIFYHNQRMSIELTLFSTNWVDKNWLCIRDYSSMTLRWWGLLCTIEKLKNILKNKILSMADNTGLKLHHIVSTLCDKSFIVIREYILCREPWQHKCVTEILYEKNVTNKIKNSPSGQDREEDTAFTFLTLKKLN